MIRRTAYNSLLTALPIPPLVRESFRVRQPQTTKKGGHLTSFFIT
jgi:hypothetical protein